MPVSQPPSDTNSFNVCNKESFGCKFKLPKEMVSIIEKLDDKRLIKTQVRNLGDSGGMRFDLTFVDKKPNGAVAADKTPASVKTSKKLRDKISFLEEQVFGLCQRLQELDCSECIRSEQSSNISDSTIDDPSANFTRSNRSPNCSKSTRVKRKHRSRAIPRS